MDQTTRGNFVAYVNRSKQAGDQRPDFQGKISIPGQDREFACALWASRDKNGKTIFTGRTAVVAHSDDVEKQIETMVAARESGQSPQSEKNLTLSADQVVLFTNTFKDEEHPKRPTYWGRWNPGKGEQLVAISVWPIKDRYGRVVLAGASTYPQPNANQEQFVEQVDAATGEIIEAPRRGRRGTGR